MREATSDDLRTAVRELVAEEAPGEASCPGADELVAFLHGDLPPDDEDRIRDHLLTCPEDTSLLLDLERLERDELGADMQVSEFEMAAAWKATRSRLAAAGGAASETGGERPSAGRTVRPPVRSFRQYWPHAVAAAFLLATAGLSIQVRDLRQTVDDLSRPELDAQVKDLYAGTLRGGDAKVEEIFLDPGERLFTLILNTGRPPGGETYDLEVVRDGRTAWEARALRPHASGALSVTLSRRLMGPGDYRLRLYPAGDAGPEPAFEFALRIAERAEGGGAG